MSRLPPHLASFSAIGILAFFALTGTARAESACGIVDGHTVTNCENIRDKTTCTEKCEPVSMVKMCSTQCDGSCTETTTTDCTAACETESLTLCTEDPPAYECKPQCTTHCQSSCSGHCESSIDQTTCSGHCRSECDQTCEEKCTALPATETCENKVKTVCDASCIVETTVTCESECETECSTELRGACTTQCTTTEGALFCEEQYIEGGANLGDCVAEIEEAGTPVRGWVKVAADGTATGPGTEGDGVSCATGGSPASLGALLVCVLAGLLLFLAFRRRA